MNRNYKTKKERLFHLKIIRDALEEMLKRGFSPYQDKADFDNLKYSANDALDFAFTLKKNTLKDTSFRHTFITKLYRQLRASYGQSETYDKLMLITGYQTLKALQQYLRDIDAELPEDYSGFLE